MNTEFKIEKDVPMPKVYNGRTCRYPFAEMRIGDSFFVAESVATSNSVGSSVHYFRKKNKSVKFAVRREQGGCRVWRTK